MTPEIWFEYVFGTCVAIGMAALLFIFVCAMFGITFGKDDK